MICSSVNRFRFIVRLPLLGRTLNLSGGNLQWQVTAPIEAVYAAICNVGEIGYALAGVKSVEVLSEVESLWKVEVKAGIMSRTLTLNGRIVERQPPNRIAFEAVGPNVSLTGSMTLTSVDAGMTHCTAQARSEVTGRLAPVINLVAQTTQKQLITQTIANFRRMLARQGSEAQ